MARDGENVMMMQLHRVKLTGKDNVRLTDPAFNHQVSLSPDGKYFIDVYQTHDVPPVTRVVDAKGKVVAELAKSDLTKCGPARAEEDRALHLQGRRRGHRPLRHPELPLQLRPEQKVSRSS